MGERFRGYPVLVDDNGNPVFLDSISYAFGPDEAVLAARRCGEALAMGREYVVSAAQWMRVGGGRSARWGR